MRSAALAYRQGMQSNERQECSEIIIHSLLSWLSKSQDSIKCLLAYRSLPSEVDSTTLFQLPDYHVFAPVTHHHEKMEWHLATAHTKWQKGLFGVLEPESGIRWSEERGETILICPLAAFDRPGNRLGMGKGCFDYWLSRHRNRVHQVIGLAFSGQEVEAIPAEVHDAPMDIVITEREIIKCPSH